MSGSLFIISLALLVACSSAFMYLPPHEASWENAESSILRDFVQNQEKREQMESMATLSPLDLAAIYNYPFNQGGGRGMTVAVTIYGNCTYAESDLAAYNQRYGLPACTFANGCLSKITSNGDYNFPSTSSNSGGWDTECSLDIQQIHGTAPGAKILIVTASGIDSNSMNLALKYAGQHANYVSASWGYSEGFSAVEGDLSDAITNRGVSFFASSGDSGATAAQLYPAASSYVIALGGTTVHGSGSSATETAWSGSGGGCSTYYTTNRYQAADPKYSSLGCNGRKAVPDMAYDSDPNGSGIWIYAHVLNGWAIVGGTSAAAPRAAGRAALAGVQITPQMIYGGALQFRDITSGSNNGHNAGPGLDLVTGKGSWIGLTPGNYATPRPFPTPVPPTSEPSRADGPEGCGN